MAKNGSYANPRKITICFMKLLRILINNQIKDIVEQYQVQVLSSNYVLYAEMSRRFMKVFSDFVSLKEQEAYSIDECFLDLTAHAENYDLTEYAR